MWFKDKSKELASDLSTLLRQLMAEQPAQVRSHPNLQRHPELLGFFEQLAQRWQEQLHVQRKAQATPPPPCSAADYQQLLQQLATAERQARQLDEQLQQCHAELASNAARRHKPRSR